MSSNRPKLLRTIYRELRTSLGCEFTAIEVYDLANRLIGIEAREDRNLRFSLREGRSPFEAQGIDKIFADGGWRVLEIECQEYMDIKTREYYELWLSNRISRWISVISE